MLGDRRRWVGAEWSGIWEGVSPSQPTMGHGGASWAPQCGSRAEPRLKNEFWRILKATERSFLYLYDKIWGGTICISIPYSKFWGTCSLVPVWSTPTIITEFDYPICLLSIMSKAQCTFWCSLNLYAFKCRITSLIFTTFAWCPLAAWCPKRAFSSLMG